MAEKKIKRPLGIAKVLPGKCIACGARCAAECKQESITMDEKGEPIIDAGKCVGCRKCVRICPAEAIEMYFTPEELKIIAELDAAKKATGVKTQEPEEEQETDETLEKIKQYKGVWVFLEHSEGKPADVSWELLGVGAGLAKIRGVELCSVIIGDKVEHLCKEAFSYGASKAYIVDDPVFHYYRTRPYYKAACYLVEKYKPEIVLIGATGLGRDLASAVATILGTGLTADCTGLAIDERGFLMQTRPAFGGNIMATIMTERTRPQMSTVRPHVMKMPEKDDSRTGQVISEKAPIVDDDILVKVLEILEEKRGAEDDVDVSAAEVIVSGGRGVGNKENFSMLQELADELKGVVGCTRSVVEAGWMPIERQIGQTGKTVRPKIYIACGISGAIQHLVGMQDSDVIIAINRDKTAPIFEVATYSIVGDVVQVVPAIIKRIRELRKHTG
ncbi:FAD-binding protein [Chloroflexota bacterium]